MHRDLKSANVFLYKDGTAKLGDLNVSKIIKSGLGYTQTGTPYYASPEVWKDKPYDIKSDIWSLGWVLYEMTTLKPPFRAEDMNSLYKVVLKGVYPKIPSKYSKDLNLVIKTMIQVNPKRRPTWRDILEFESIVIKDQERYCQTEEDEEPSNTSLLLQTIYVPKDLILLTDNLPKPKYEATTTSSNYNISENEKKIFKFDKKKSPTLRMKQKSHNLILPKIRRKRDLTKLSDYSNYEQQGNLREIMI